MQSYTETTKNYLNHILKNMKQEAKTTFSHGTLIKSTSESKIIYTFHPTENFETAIKDYYYIAECYKEISTQEQSIVDELRRLTTKSYHKIVHAVANLLPKEQNIILAIIKNQKPWETLEYPWTLIQEAE